MSSPNISSRQWTGIIVLSVAAAAILAEMILTYRASDQLTIPFYNRLYPYTMFQPHPNLEFVSRDLTSPGHVMSHHTRPVTHYTQEDGFRIAGPGYSLSKVKPPGQLRVAILGGSAVQTGSSFESTIAGSLKLLLQRRFQGRDVEVINAGIVSSVSRQAIVYLLFTVLEYQPDVVILYDGFNDLMLPLNYESRPNFPYNFQTVEAAWEEYRREHRSPLWRLVLDRSRLYRALRGRLVSDGGSRNPGLLVGANAKSAPEVLADPEWVDSHVGAYLSNWNQLIALSLAYGFEPVCILQPTAAFDQEHGLKVLAEGYGLDDVTARDWIEAIVLLYGQASRRIETLSREHQQYTVTDFSRLLLPAEPHFWDIVHVYDESNEVVARGIVDQVWPGGD